MFGRNPPSSAVMSGVVGESIVSGVSVSIDSEKTRRRPGRRENEYPYKTVAFDVHKIDREEGGGGKLRYVDGSLNGLAMFVGLNHSFAVMPTNGELKPDSIYFTDDKVFNPRNSNYIYEEEKMYVGHDIGIYDYEKKTISPCYYPCEVGRLKRIKREDAMQMNAHDHFQRISEECGRSTLELEKKGNDLNELEKELKEREVRNENEIINLEMLKAEKSCR
ncbi:hypothetical protein STAS_18110 [Striga asiatica]|uniref:KIB1-4 beta-propeller domain-containing protein n=1 Tax=Striga asiatica TaxID=4170 RepID=A0A5A7Q8W7_STRAF|nr:hypothetical protein STAS_18110 [Striga asiatica]